MPRIQKSSYGPLSNDVSQVESAIGDANNSVEFEGSTAHQLFGYSVSNAGDVDGDGFDDILIGAPGYGPGSDLLPGAAYLIFGEPGDVGDRIVVFEGGEAGDQFGISVSGAGDVNGDGYGDFIIGSNNAGVVTPDDGAGKSYLVFGQVNWSYNSTILLDSASSNTNPVRFIFGGSTKGARAGWSVSGAGDVDGDGYSDFLIGAPYSNYNVAAGTVARESVSRVGKAALSLFWKPAPTQQAHMPVEIDPIQHSAVKKFQ